jgi:hypothetical protein
VFLSNVSSAHIAQAVEIWINHVRRDLKEAGVTDIHIELGEVIVSDSALYFKTDEVNRVFQRNGMKSRIYAAPYSPEKVAVERMFKTMSQSVESMMYARDVDPGFWPEAWAHAAAIYDILTHSTLGVSPFQKRTGRTPSWRHLHPFGSRAWVWAPRKLKSDHKGTDAVYLGYHRHSLSHMMATQTSDGRWTKRSSQHCLIDGRVPDRYMQHQLPPIFDADWDFNPKMGVDSTKPLIRVELPVITDTTTTAPTRLTASTATTTPTIAGATTRAQRLPPVGITDALRSDFPAMFNSTIVHDPDDVYHLLPDMFEPEVGDVNATTTDKEVFYNWSAAKRAKDGYLFTPQVIADELDYYIKSEKWVRVSSADVQPGEVIHNTQSLYTFKYDADGNRCKGKLRIVFSSPQKKGVDYETSAAYMPRTATINTHLAFEPDDPAATRSALIDVHKAYSHPKRAKSANRLRTLIKIGRDLQETDQFGNTYYYALQCKQYGEGDAGTCWQTMFWEKLLRDGWTQSKVDPCLWFRGKARLLIYVDDAHIRAIQAEIDRFYREMCRDFAGCTITDGSNFLRLTITRSPDGTHSKCAELAIQQLLARYPQVKLHDTPFPKGLSGLRSRQRDTESEPCDISEYRSIRGSIQYIAIAARADIAFAASLHGQVVHPTKADWRILMHTLGYLKRTANKRVTYKLQQPASRNVLFAYSDASFAGNAGAKSQAGFVIFMNGAPIAFKSACLKYTSLSTDESELCAASMCAREIIFLRDLLTDLGAPPTRPTPLRIDATAALSFIESRGISERTKHVQTKFYHLKELLRDKVIDPQHIDTKLNVADLMTKALAVDAHQRHERRLVCAVSIPTATPPVKYHEMSVRDFATLCDEVLAPTPPLVPRHNTGDIDSTYCAARLPTMFY